MTHPRRSTRATRVLRGWAMCLVLSLGSAQAAVYRCGNTYQDSPCPGGRTVAADDARSPEQRAAAREVHLAERERADALAAERRRQQQRQRPATAPAGITVRQPDALDALPSDHPCATPPGRHAGKARSRTQCLNGLPVYVARPAQPAR